MRGEQTVLGHIAAALLVLSLIFGFLVDKHGRVEDGHGQDDKKDCADVCKRQVETAGGAGTRMGFRARGYGGRWA